MLYALWRCLNQAFHVTSSGAGSEDPVVTTLKVVARKPDLDAILQRDGTSGSRQQPIIVLRLMIPTQHSGMPVDAVGVGWDVIIKGNDAIHLVDVLDLDHCSGYLAIFGVVLAVLGVVVEYLYLVAHAQCPYPILGYALEF